MYPRLLAVSILTRTERDLPGQAATPYSYYCPTVGAMLYANSQVNTSQAGLTYLTTSYYEVCEIAQPALRWVLGYIPVQT